MPEVLEMGLDNGEQGLIKGDIWEFPIIEGHESPDWKDPLKWNAQGRQGKTKHHEISEYQKLGGEKKRPKSSQGRK